MASTPATLETALPLEDLLRLPEVGLAGFPRLESLALRGDWRTRALALSAIGRLVRDDPSAWKRLKLDLVDEHICWFEDAGSVPVYVAL